MLNDPLDALRLANPDRSLPALAPAELDDRRRAIATPNLGGAPARPKRRKVRWIGLLAAAALTVLGSVALATGFRPWERDPARQAGPGEANTIFQREYAAAQKVLALPPGVRWPRRSIPSDTIIGIGRGGNAEGSAVLIAFGAWSCYVVQEHRRGNTSGVHAGVVALRDLVDNHIIDVPPGTPEDGAAPSALTGPIAQFAPGDEPSKTVFGRWITKAGHGDVSDLANECLVNRPVASP